MTSETTSCEICVEQLFYFGNEELCDCCQKHLCNQTLTCEDCDVVLSPEETVTFENDLGAQSSFCIGCKGDISSYLDVSGIVNIRVS